MSSPMKPLIQIGHRPHAIDRTRYGQPRIALYWAGAQFVYRGLVLWTGRRNVRLLALNRFGDWFGDGS